MGKTTRILFIGNSFTGRNGLARMLEQMAASASPPREVETKLVLANGMALKTHWERGIAIEAIRGSKWDFVVLQEQSTLPLKNRAKMHEYITKFVDTIREHGATPVLYMTWARQNVWERQDELADAYTSIGRKLEAVVAPVGTVWQKAFERSPGLVLHDKDASHPNPAGTFLAACAFYAMLFEASPVGLPIDPSLTSKYGAEVLRLLQQVAWETAKEFTSRKC
jgi:hypothetical protein